MFAGKRFWFYLAQMGFVTNEDETGGVLHGRELWYPPLEAAAWIPAYEFTLLGEATQTERPGIRLLARA